MAEIVKNWDNGGSLSVVFTGDGDGTAVISSTENEGDEREAEVSFIDASRSVIVVRKVVQAAMAEVVDADYFNLYLETSEGRFRFSNELEYSYDKTTWIKLPANVWSEEMVSPGNSAAYLRGSLKPTPGIGIGTFEFDNCQYSTGGNPLSLIFGNRCDSVRDLTGYDYAFYKLFYNCNVIPSFYFFNQIDTLSPYCFAYMFAGDTRHGNLFDFTIPDIASLAPYCFYNMFANLGMELYEDSQTIKLTTTAPHCFDGMFRNTDINGITMKFEEFSDGCCNNMFNGCSELSYIKINILSPPNEQYCLNWVEGVAESGQFIKREDAEWEDTFGPSAIPEGWDVSTDSGSGNLFMQILDPSSGEMIYEIYDIQDNGVEIYTELALAKFSQEPIRNPLLIALHPDSEMLIPWRSQHYEVIDDSAVYISVTFLKTEAPPYVGLFYDVLIALDDMPAEGFVFYDLSGYDTEAGEWTIAFAVMTNGVRVSEDSEIHGLSQDEYYILDITDEYIIFGLYSPDALLYMMSYSHIGFVLYSE